MPEPIPFVRGEPVTIIGPKPDGWQGLGSLDGEILVRYPDGELGAVPEADIEFKGPRRTQGEPHDRLTRICDAMTTTLDEHPEHSPDDKAMIFLDDGKRGGIVLHGYESDADALTDLLTHLEVLFQTQGIPFHIVPVTINQG
jgi:hypothetical protein